MAAMRSWPKFEPRLSGSCRSRRMKSDFTSLIIRRAELADAEAITEIYNEAILATTATFDTEAKEVAERIEWLKLHDDRHPVLVALSENKIVGWSALSRWSERRAYDDTAETSFYVRSDFRARGIGRKLKEATIEEARRLGFHTLIARVAEGRKSASQCQHGFLSCRNPQRGRT